MRNRMLLSIIVLIASCVAVCHFRPTHPQSPILQSAPIVPVLTASTPLLPPLKRGGRGGEFLRIAATPDGFAPCSAGFQPAPDPNSHWKNPAKPVEPAFPKNFSAPVRVRSGIADVRAIPLNANAASVGEIAADGTLVYKNAFEGCDVQYRCTPLKTEEFIVVKERTEGRGLRTEVTAAGASHSGSVTQSSVLGPQSFSWSLDTGSGDSALKPRLTPAHTIELCDTAGVPRLRINAPEGKDANGKLLRAGEQLALKLEGNCVTLSANLDGCAFPVTIDPTWSSTGSMAVARDDHTATLLGTGKVLVAGGVNGGFALNSSELFDPVAGTWSATTGSLGTGRYWHAATLLGNGKVLVAGGNDIGGYVLNSSELYDPVAGTWSATTGPLGTGRYLPTATLLGNGKVLVAGGVNAGGFALNSSELYDPVAGTWSATTGPLGTARYLHTATLLGTGKVLVAGGVNGGGVLNSSELYDPVAGTWSATTGSLGTARSAHTATLLGNGQVLVAGGGSGAVFAFNSPELYDPVAGTWSTTGSLGTGRSWHTATLLGNGKVLVAGGEDNSGLLINSCEAYDPVAGTWSATTALGTGRYQHTATLLGNGTVLVAGGLGNGSVTLQSCEIFNPRPDAFPQSISTHFGTSTSITLTGATLAPPLSFTVTNNPINGVLSGAPPNLTYAPNPFYTGSDSLQFKVTDTFYGTSQVATVTITMTNQPPVVSISGSPTLLIEGQSASFTSTASDPDGDPLTYLWNFGDGGTSTDPNPTHVYATAGVYQATCTVTDIANASTTSNTVTIHVFHDSDRPTARFTSSALNGFVGQPIGFDATFSTDPKNNIVSYSWDFGDGSPLGSGQAISRVYTAEGTYTVTLTIVDGDGLTDITTLTMVILPAAQAGLLNSNIKYSVSWNRSATNADKLSLTAAVNVGSTPVAASTPLSLNVVGQTFTGSSTTKLALLSAKAGAQSKFQIKRNTKKGAPKGSYSLKVSVSHASLGQAFALAGAIGTKTATTKIPIKLGIGASNFSSGIPSSFKFGGNGKASGGGQGPK